MKPSAYSRKYAALRAWLKAKRQGLGLSLRDAGALVGRHHSVIGKLEQNRRRIDLAEFVEYCEALGLDPHEGLDVFMLSHGKSPS